jgi:hypothetical protein
MKQKDNTKNLPNKQAEGEEKINPSGYPLYPTKEDVYSKWKEEKDLNPEDVFKIKAPNDKVGTNNEKDFSDDVSGSDLDVPGSASDDAYKKVGNEDEENNYYSLGGDDHNDLEEDKGE